MGKSTTAMLEENGWPFWTVYNLIRRKKISEPPRFGKNSFIWYPEHVEQVRRALSAEAAA